MGQIGEDPTAQCLQRVRFRVGKYWEHWLWDVAFIRAEPLGGVP